MRASACLAGAAGSAACSGPVPSSAPGSDSSAAAERELRLDELFADLRDQSGSVEAIQPPERAARRKLLGTLLADRGLDALLLEGGATMRYLVGFSWGLSERLFALVVLADGSHFWLCPAFEEGRARLRIDAPEGPGGEILTWQEDEYPFRPLAAALEARGVERLVVEPSLRVRFPQGLAALAPQLRIEAGSALLTDLRGRKDAHELALLRRANELTQRGIAAAAEHIRPGMRGDEIAALVRHAQARLGLRNIWVLALIGPDAAYPHGGTAPRKLHTGEGLLIDTGGELHEYQSDNTRSWVPEGPIPPDFDRAWKTVQEAQQRAFAALQAGKECRSVDRAARAVIEAAGYPPGFQVFTHRLGHGIGLEGHESPYLDGGSRVILAPGMSFSDEPGIYVPGHYGVRIEDIIAVGAEGPLHFGSWQRSPRSPG